MEPGYSQNGFLRNSIQDERILKLCAKLNARNDASVRRPRIHYPITAGDRRQKINFRPFDAAPPKPGNCSEHTSDDQQQRKFLWPANKAIEHSYERAYKKSAALPACRSIRFGNRQVDKTNAFLSMRLRKSIPVAILIPAIRAIGTEIVEHCLQSAG